MFKFVMVVINFRLTFNFGKKTDEYYMTWGGVGWWPCSCCAGICIEICHGCSPGQGDCVVSFLTVHLSTKVYMTVQISKDDWEAHIWKSKKKFNNSFLFKILGKV